MLPCFSHPLPSRPLRSLFSIALRPSRLPRTCRPARTSFRRHRAEIVTATDDGKTLIYSDSPLGAIGFIDITDAKAPKAGGALMMDGEPTSVTSAAGKALVAVNTGESKAKPSGRLAIVDVATKKIENTCDLGGQPDSIALNKDKTLGTIAIENERDEDVNDGKIPQMPAGDLVIFKVKDGTVDCGTIKHVTLTGLSAIAPEDPEPEFVSFNSQNEIALTLQENNEIVIIDGNTAEVKTHFSAGSTDLSGIDTKKDGALNFTGEMKGVLREPDAVKWLDDNRLVVANEGDYEGGSRGFTIFDKTGKVLYESGAAFERAVAEIGHYPDGRSVRQGRRAGRPRSSDLRRPAIFLPALRAGFRRRCLQGHRCRTGTLPDPSLGRFAGRRRCHSVAQPHCDRQRSRSR